MSPEIKATHVTEGHGEILLSFERHSGNASNLVLEHNHVIEMLAAEKAKAAKLVEVLGLSELAIEALCLTQKDQGMGLLGSHFVAPETLKRIREALAALPKEHT